MPSTLSRRLFRATLPLAALFALAACGSGSDADGGDGAWGAGPPPLVVAMTVKAQSIPNIVELPGRIEAVRTAEVRARSDGIIERRLYQEGTDVVEGAPLFRIDPRDLNAQVDQARATLRRAEAARTNAQQIVRRYAPLVADRSVSALEFDQAQATLRQEDANVADARAALARAQLQQSYTIVRAPIAGRVGRAQVTEGALVSASSATPLATVVIVFALVVGALANKGEEGAEGEEFKAAQLIDSMPEIEYWVRNVAGHPNAFKLPVSGGWTYPDFVAKLKGGRLLVVEYKGGHLVADSVEKRNIGELWEASSEGRGVYVFAEREVDGKDVRGQIRSALS